MRASRACGGGGLPGRRLLRQGAPLQGLRPSAGEAPLPSARLYRFPAGSPFPCRGDSLRILPRAYLDTLGNPAAQAGWLPITGPRPSRRAEIGVLSPAANPHLLPTFLPASDGPLAALIDPAGRPLVDNPGNRLVAASPGPVFLLDVTQALESLSLACFDHLGRFLGRAYLPVGEAEWRAIRAYSAEAGPDAVRRIRIKWYPAASGRLMGTGVYILQGHARSRRGVARDGNGAEIDLVGAERTLRPLRFGILRL